MRNLYTHLTVGLLLFFGITLLAQTNGNGPLPTKVIKAVKESDASGLLPFLNNKVELVLPEKSGVFSKDQSLYILKKFFADNQVTSFNLVHHGTRQNATFAIGNYQCANENYRMYFLVKKSGDNILIHQIRIEKQE